jgi:hypothetical protein
MEKLVDEVLGPLLYNKRAGAESEEVRLPGRMYDIVLALP